MNHEPYPPLPPEEPPRDPGSIGLGCGICFAVVVVGGYFTFGLIQHYPFNLLVPLGALLIFSIAVARSGWSRTYTGIAIGLLLTLGFILLLKSICGGGF